MGRVSDVMYAALRKIVKLSTGSGNRGFKVTEAEAEIGTPTLEALQVRGLIVRRRMNVGRFSKPITFFQPTGAGFELVNG